LSESNAFLAVLVNCASVILSGVKLGSVVCANCVSQVFAHVLLNQSFAYSTIASFCAACALSTYWEVSRYEPVGE
jgi:hypothetical protein